MVLASTEKDDLFIFADRDPTHVYDDIIQFHELVRSRQEVPIEMDASAKELPCPFSKTHEMSVLAGSSDQIVLTGLSEMASLGGQALFPFLMEIGLWHSQALRHKHRGETTELIIRDNFLLDGQLVRENLKECGFTMGDVCRSLFSMQAFLHPDKCMNLDKKTIHKYPVSALVICHGEDLEDDVKEWTQSSTNGPTSLQPGFPRHVPLLLVCSAVRDGFSFACNPCLLAGGHVVK